MARVMIIGYGPLPRADLQAMTSAVLRTRQLVQAIREAGHTVNLFTLPIAGAEARSGEPHGMRPDHDEGLGYQRFTTHSGEFAIQMLEQQARALEPDALLGINTYPSYVAAMLPLPLPLWVDLNGYWMAENQGLCWLDQDDARLADAWAIERTILRRMDKFSAVSRPQLHAVLGELASVGRMNRYTFDYPFGHYLPNGWHRLPRPVPAEAGAEDAPPPSEVPILRGPIVPEEAFIILWSGSFHPSADVSLLVSMLNKLMDRYPTVHFVATGGRMEQMIARTYQVFQELVEQSPHKARFHLMGWIEAGRLPAIYREADLGINVDARNYETFFGARARINQMAAEGLPIATTLGTEISEWLADGRAVMAAPLGDADALAEAIEPWIEQREQLKVYATRAKRIMQRDFSNEATARRLLEWLKKPRLAPDNQAKIQQARGLPIDLLGVSINPLEEQARLLSQYPVETLAAAAARMDASRAHKGFLFGLRR